MRVLLTRPFAEAQTSAARLRALGHEPLVAPLLEIVSVEANLPDGDLHALIATSAHAFGFFSGDPTRLLGLPAYVVGEKTAAAAQTFGVTRLAAVAKDSRDLAEVILAQTDPGACWIYLAGRSRRRDLETALASAGREVEIAVVYEARAAAELPPLAQAALRSDALDAVLHYSARSAALFRECAVRTGLEAQAAALLHVAISPSAASPLRDFAHNLRIAAFPDERRLFEALEGRA